MKKESCEKGLSGVYVVSKGLCTSTPTEPYFVDVPQGGKFPDGSQQTFSARAEGAGVQYSWHSGDKELGEGADFTTTVSAANAGSWRVRAAVCTGPLAAHHACAVGAEKSGRTEPEGQCCKVHGDPHIMTFDKVKYDYMGSCTYILSAAADYRWMVYGGFVPCGDRTKQLSCITSITVIHEGELVQFLRMWRVNYNGNEFMIPKGGTRDLGGIRIANNAMKYTISLGDTGVWVIWDGMTTSQICLPTKCAGGVMGLCADADCDKDNEFDRRGAMNLYTRSWAAKSSSEFANSWAVQETGCDLEPEDGMLPAPRTRPCEFVPEEQRAQYNARCLQILGLQVFQDCLARTSLDQEALLAHCLFDSCAGLSLGGGCPGATDQACAQDEAGFIKAVAGGMARELALSLFKPAPLDPACMAGMNLAKECRAWGAFIPADWRQEVTCPSDEELGKMKVCP